MARQASDRLAVLLDEIRAELVQDCPGVVETICGPAAMSELHAWAEAIHAELPAPLGDLYRVYGGTPDRGSHGFSVVGDYRVLPVSEAIAVYDRMLPLLTLWGLTNDLVPFACDPGGCYLAISGVDDSMWRTLVDTPPVKKGFDIAALLARTCDALRGDDPDWRADREGGYLMWIDLRAERLWRERRS